MQGCGVAVFCDLVDLLDDGEAVGVLRVAGEHATARCHVVDILPTLGSFPSAEGVGLVVDDAVFETLIVGIYRLALPPE